MHVVADDADVVRGRGPGQRRLPGAAGRVQAGGRGRGRRVRDGRARLGAGRADVAGGVLGGDLVEVGARGEAGVGVARPRRLGDPVRGARREAGGGRAVHVVADDADVVRRGGPGERDRGSGRVCGQAGRGARRSRIGDRRRDLVRGGREIPGRVLGDHLVVVGAQGEDARVAVGRPGGLCDPVRGRGREPGGRVAVHVVAGDSHVVRRRSPAQVDRAAGHRGREVGWCRRRRRVGRRRRARFVRG